ncbi:acyl-CoA carboxylase epsilon subunit [Angustibacter aerolatus]
MSEQPDATPPALRVVRGTPSPEELVAVVAVLAARGGAPEPARAPRPQWSDPSRTLRGGVAPSRVGWRARHLP